MKLSKPRKTFLVLVLLVLTVSAISDIFLIAEITQRLEIRGFLVVGTSIWKQLVFYTVSVIVIKHLFKEMSE